MKPPFLLSFLLVLLAPAALPAAERAPIVVLISVDGLAADYFADAHADLPTLRRMARDGAWAESMMSVFPTVTWPNHTRMVTGVWPARHGVVGNRYYDRFVAMKHCHLKVSHEVTDCHFEEVLSKTQGILNPTPK